MKYRIKHAARLTISECDLYNVERKTRFGFWITIARGFNSPQQALQWISDQTEMFEINNRLLGGRR